MVRMRPVIAVVAALLPALLRMAPTAPLPGAVTHLPEVVMEAMVRPLTAMAPRGRLPVVEVVAVNAVVFGYGAQAVAPVAVRMAAWC
jgi:hypothetical protein